MQASLRACEVCGGQSFAKMFDKLEHRFVKCSACALERIEPQPSDDELAAIYGEHYYNNAWGLGRDKEIVADLKRRTFGYVLSKVPVPGGKLLDCGAATGFLLEVAKERGFEPYGVELSEFGADEIARKFGKNRSFRGDLGDARFDDAGEGDFSVVTMCDYIEHVRDPRAALELAHRLLRPGGAVAITTPDTGSLSRRALASGWTHYKIEHLFYFNRGNITKLLREVGFSDVTFPPLFKRLNVRYVRHQFDTYSHPVLTRASRALSAVLPDALQSQPVPVLTGELLAIARR
jgi:2-polyprenyl-3-methyl-5-hydroxy-6-metoxy-1,4-benzoquinol methylase